jgi:hypothetical protein
MCTTAVATRRPLSTATVSRPASPSNQKVGGLPSIAQRTASAGAA